MTAKELSGFSCKRARPQCACEVFGEFCGEAQRESARRLERANEAGLRLEPPGSHASALAGWRVRRAGVPGKPCADLPRVRCPPSLPGCFCSHELRFRTILAPVFHSKRTHSGRQGGFAGGWAPPFDALPCVRAGLRPSGRQANRSGLGRGCPPHAHRMRIASARAGSSLDTDEP